MDLKRSFCKPALTYAQQIELLESRGMEILEKEKAKDFLAWVSYYRLSGYWFNMLRSPKEDHVFDIGANFELAMELYRFDSKLRTILIAAIEKIEVAIRAKMVYHLSHAATPTWYADESLFRDHEDFEKTLARIRAEYHRSDEGFVSAFRSNYNDSNPPSWIMFEIATFGLLSRLFKNLNDRRVRRLISNEFGLHDAVFESWLHTFVYIRNMCAHHSRLWNKQLRVRPIFPRNTRKKWLTSGIMMAPYSNRKIFFVISMILYFMQSISDTTEFRTEILNLIAAFPTIDLTSMGFPTDWEKEHLWCA